MRMSLHCSYMLHLYTDRFRIHSGLKHKRERCTDKIHSVCLPVSMYVYTNVALHNLIQNTYTPQNVSFS